MWAAYAASAYGSGLGFGALSLVAITLLHAGPAAVSGISAAGLAIGAVLALPLGAWMEPRRKRPVMITADLVRCAALLSVPATFALGWLGLPQLVAVAVVAAAAKIAFNAAAGAHLKALLAPEDLVVANSRFEATTWGAITLGPPLGGAVVGLLGPVVAVVANAAGYLLSALGIAAIPGQEHRPERTGTRPLRSRDLLDGWRLLLTHPTLRPLFLNTVLVNGLIMATEPLAAVLMLGELGFSPWQYGLAFAAPCLGGLIGSRLARHLVPRHGQHRVLRVAGTVRVCWPIGLALVQPGTVGVITVIAVQLGLVTAVSIYNPVLAAYRLDQTPNDRTARALTAWSITSTAMIATLTALWGLLGSVLGPRAAIAAAGALLLATPALLPRSVREARPPTGPRPGVPDRSAA
ncbi:MFS transporter [Pseudonocardia sp. MH-G8]|nr:MFS transporter [Pseudonocardia sp. MH-G8]